MLKYIRRKFYETFEGSLSVILCVCILFSTMLPAFAVDTTDTTPETTVLYGDADTDGDIDMQDLLLMEKYIAGKDVEINEKHADVNADGYINGIDVQMLRDYLVGNIDSLTPELVSVSFVTDGGGEFEPMQVGKGYGIVKELPTPAKTDYIFTGWKKSDGSDFYKEDAVNEDITLVAQYEAIEKQEELKIDSYAVTDCETDVKFIVTGNFSSAEEIKNNITLIPKDGSDPVEIKVESNNDGTFSVGAVVSFTPGASYELALGDGVFFVDKEETIRSVDFIIKKTEGDRLYYNENVKFIKDTAEMVYSVDGKEGTQDVLEAALLNNEESNDDITGTFIMSGGGLAEKDIVCIYTGTDPRDRDYTKDENDNYDGEAVAYIRIKEVNGNTYSFESLDNKDISEVILMPDSIPFKVDELPTGETGTVGKDDYDTNARAKLGFEKAPEYKKGDFLTFYTESFEKLNESDNVVYGQVTNVLENTVEYKIVSKEYIEDFMGMFVKNEIDKEKILENINEEELLQDVAQQVEESSFAEESAGYMLQSAMQDKKVEDAMLNNGMTKAEFNKIATSADFSANPTGIVVGRTKVEVEQGPTVVPTLIIGDQFKNGVGVRLDVGIILSVNTKLNKVLTSLKIDLNASFTQEVAFGIDVDVEDEWTWYGPIPVPEELSVYTSVDIQSYTNVSVSATMYSVHEDVKKKWKALSDKYQNDPWMYGLIKQYDKLAVQAQKLDKKTEKYKETVEQMDEILSGLPKIVVDGEEFSYSRLCEELEAVTVANSFADNAEAESAPEAQVSMQKLMDKYSDLMENESDWVQLAYYELFDKDFNIKIVAINVKVTLVMRGNINLSLGADLEYKVGKRYNFWIHCVSCEAGSSEQDLVDERFALQLYVMGTIGIRAGVKAEVNIGIISTKLGSIGASIEFGPYFKIWGYFCYVYTKLRPANSNMWNEKEELLGAIYLEFGLYLTVKFKAQVFDDLFKFEPTLYDGEFPLLTAGALKAVYGFANVPDSDDKLKVVDNDSNISNGASMEIPSSYRQMKIINVQTGEQSQERYETGDFNFTSSSRYFTVDSNGIITVNPPSDAEYLESEITVTWKNSKLGFSKFDMAITIPVYWTNLTDEQISEKYTASVAVGNATDGYTTVWSGRFTRLEEFNLPMESEILDLIKYDSYNDENGVNLKYGEVEGYKESTTGLTIKEDTTYYFDVTPRQYVIKVNGVQKVDGSTTTRTYKAEYGETVDFTDLVNTGANNTEKDIYTSFLNLTKADDSEATVELQSKVNLGFADMSKASGEIELTANYTDRRATAKFTFDGVNLDSKTIYFKKGEIPNFEKIEAYVDQWVKEYDIEGLEMIDIVPPLEKVEHSIVYVVNCKLAEPAPEYTLSFDTMGGNQIASKTCTEGSFIYKPLVDPVRTGYTFAGWYADSGYKTKFEFNKMPENDVTVYAKWEANLYTVNYVSQSSLYGDAKTIIYNEEYYLPTLEDQDDWAFIGWELNGSLLTSGTKFTELKNVTLEAKWSKKEDITDPIDASTQHYPNGSHKFDLKKVEAYSNLDFEVQYRLNGTQDKFSTAVPTTEGAYDVLVTRASDRDYKYFEKTYYSALIIGKIDLGITNSDLKAYVRGNTIVVRRPDKYKGDGEITYTLNVRNSGSEVFEAKNSTGVFAGVKQNTNYSCTVNIAASEYYKSDSATINVTTGTLIKEKGYTVDFLIKTSEDNYSGTDSDVWGQVLYSDGTLSEKTYLTGHGDDLEHGDEDEYRIVDNVCPWDVAGYKFTKNNEWAGADWKLDKVTVILLGNGKKI